MSGFFTFVVYSHALVSTCFTLTWDLCVFQAAQDAEDEEDDTFNPREAKAGHHFVKRRKPLQT